MYIYDLAMPIMEQILADEVATMALFTAYINNYPGYELFCSDLPTEYFPLLRSELKQSNELRDALLDSPVLDCGVETYLERAFKSYDMWCCLSDGTETIISSPDLLQRLFSDDRRLVEDMFFLWRSGLLNQENWYDMLNKFKKEDCLW